MRTEQNDEKKNNKLFKIPHLNTFLSAPISPELNQNLLVLAPQYHLSTSFAALSLDEVYVYDDNKPDL